MKHKPIPEVKVVTLSEEDKQEITRLRTELNELLKQLKK
jgi:hypothetical protein